MEISQKAELPRDPAILFLGIYQKKTPKTLIREDRHTPMSTETLFKIAKI